MAKGMARVTPNSRTGRSLIRVGVEHDPWKIPKEIADHNRMVDEKKAAKKATKKAASANAG